MSVELKEITVDNKAKIINNHVVEKQTLDVDLVSGATVSSKVILKAIENALSK